jgi:dienelactone hydrolase
MKRLFGVLALVSLSAHAGLFGPTEFTKNDVEFFQPPIVSTEAPARPLFGDFSLYNNTTRVGLDTMRPIIPAFNGQGNLLASWNPHPAGVKGRPTIVMVHGGHGLVPIDFAEAVWARDELKANVLILDSYWSRGRQENWDTLNNMGANMRMLDAIAAGRWLQSQGIDRDKLFIMGGSQGGWTVLRTFTDENFMQENAKNLYRGGIALYPVCSSRGWRTDPQLGPYWGPVIVFTAGRDEATDPRKCPSSVFKETVSWVHYPDATHGFDAANRGAHTPAVDGECGRAKNVHNHFPVCRSDAATNDMHEKTTQFIRSLQ